jgi:hypothetical protein
MVGTAGLVLFSIVDLRERLPSRTLLPRVDSGLILYVVVVVGPEVATEDVLLLGPGIRSRRGEGKVCRCSE